MKAVRLGPRTAADEVRALVRPYAGGLPVSVYVDDIVLPGEETPELPPPAGSEGPTGAKAAKGAVTSVPLDEVVPPPTAGPTSTEEPGATA